MDSEEVFALATHDRVLITAIINKRKALEKGDIEVFKRHENIIATEEGYYLASYADELNRVGTDPDEEKPFIGADGRLKVKAKDHEDNEVELDVAEMVAQQFVPNPLGCKFVELIDGNPYNCNKNNLRWTFELKNHKNG